MGQDLTAKTLKAQQEKLKEIQTQQEKLKKLQVELERLNLKIKNNEKLTVDETKFFGELGWLSALAVTIASIAASL
jgi:hypothetical protein